MSDLPMKSSRSGTARRLLAPGSRSASHREALLFGAGEYERLARALSGGDGEERDLANMVLEKANQLRALADGRQEKGR
jgi:hypothetical protein